MSEEKKLIGCREDWIARFFGYLGSFKYLKNQRDGWSQFLEKLQCIICNSDEGTSNDNLKKADNIVYIYGNPNDGKSSYVDLLQQELVNYSEYVCVRYGFAKTKTEVQADTIPNEIRGQFENQIRDQFETPVDFTFQFMNDFYNQEECKVNWIELIESVRELISGKLSAVKGIVGEIDKVLDPKKDHNVKSQSFYEEYERIIEKYNTKITLEEFIAINPYIFFMMDMWINIKTSDEVQYICIIDDFESFINRLAASTKEVKEKNVRDFMNMMKDMSDIVWVLISNEKPDSTVSEYINPLNSWRMKGIDKVRTIEYAKKKCGDEKIFPGSIKELWYEMLYEKTGGYISLINMCINREKMTKEEGEGEDSVNWVINCRDCEKEEGTVTDEDLKGEKKEKKYREYLEKWFKSVWNGNNGGYSKLQKGKSIEQVFFDKFIKARVEDEEKNLYMPTLCYLVEESKMGKGTVQQYSWNKNNENYYFTSAARQCIKYIVQECMFCLEYTEYPDTVFLDPIIVDILSQHKSYVDWVEEFKERGIEDREKQNTYNIANSEEARKILPQGIYEVEKSDEELTPKREVHLNGETEISYNRQWDDFDVEEIKSDEVDKEPASNVIQFRIPKKNKTMIKGKDIYQEKKDVTQVSNHREKEIFHSNNVNHFDSNNNPNNNPNKL